MADDHGASLFHAATPPAYDHLREPPALSQHPSMRRGTAGSMPMGQPTKRFAGAFAGIPHGTDDSVGDVTGGAAQAAAAAGGYSAEGGGAASAYSGGGTTGATGGTATTGGGGSQPGVASSEVNNQNAGSFSSPTATGGTNAFIQGGRPAGTGQGYATNPNAPSGSGTTPVLAPALAGAQTGAIPV